MSNKTDKFGCGVFLAIWGTLLFIAPAFIPSSYAWHSYGFFFPIFFVEEMAEATNMSTEDMWYGAIFMQIVWIGAMFLTLVLAPIIGGVFDMIEGLQRK